MAVTYLTGVVEDGTMPRPRTLPQNLRTTLEIAQGQTTQVILRVLTASGVPVTEGALLLAVAKAPGDALLISRAGVWVPSLGAGVAVFTLEANALSLAPWGRYIYDVKLTRGSVVDLVVPASPFVLHPAV